MLPNVLQPADPGLGRPTEMARPPPPAQSAIRASAPSWCATPRRLSPSVVDCCSLGHRGRRRSPPRCMLSTLTSGALLFSLHAPGCAALLSHWPSLAAAPDPPPTLPPTPSPPSGPSARHHRLLYPPSEQLRYGACLCRPAAGAVCAHRCQPTAMGLWPAEPTHRSGHCPHRPCRGTTVETRPPSPSCVCSCAPSPGWPIW